MLPTTRSYQEYLIESLKDPSEAALYIWAILQEEDPEPDLLLLALRDVAKGLGKLRMPPEQVKRHLEKLDELMAKGGSETIYGLSDWLKILGLTLTVVVEEEARDCSVNVARSSELRV